MNLKVNLNTAIKERSEEMLDKSKEENQKLNKQMIAIMCSMVANLYQLMRY